MTLQHAAHLLSLALLLTCPGGLSAWERAARHVVPPPTVPGPTLPPVFDPRVSNNVTVTATKTARLSCIVHNLGNNSVSWIRHRDLHILSVGAQTYTSDDRFEAVPQAAKGDWMLSIKYALPRDSGQYDCQVSSTPPTARTVHLTVVEPRAKILRAPEMHVGLGSPINLTCVVAYSPEPPDYLHWYHKEKMVRKDGDRVSVKTKLGRSSLSQLVVRRARPDDAGVYTCSPAHALEHSITVHVLTGEYPAAMQGGSSVTCAGRRRWALLLTATVTLSTSVLLTYFLYVNNNVLQKSLECLLIPLVIKAKINSGKCLSYSNATEYIKEEKDGGQTAAGLLALTRFL